jgi:regulator of RNase E activity RraA
MNEFMQLKVVDKIRRNRISTTEVADCLGKTGALEDVRPLTPGHHRVGPVFWVYAYNESNWELHEQVRAAPEGAVVVVETFQCGKRAVFGELVSKYLILYRQVAAIVACGLLRDTSNLLKERWPIWLEGSTPVGCFNRRNTVPLDAALAAQRSAHYRDAVAVCDDCGVVVITKEHISTDFLQALDRIEEQEDVWFDCIDRLKWDTFDTVCLRRYEHDSHDQQRRPAKNSA